MRASVHMAQTLSSTSPLKPEVLEKGREDIILPNPAAFLPPRMPYLTRRARLEAPAIPPLVTDEEMEMAVKRLRSRRRAPGPDGVPRRVLGAGAEQHGWPASVTVRLFYPCPKALEGVGSAFW